MPSHTNPACSNFPKETFWWCIPPSIVVAVSCRHLSSIRLLDQQGLLLRLLYSDGLTDAQNLQDEMFGEARLLELIQQEAPSGSHALEEKLLKAIDDFTQGTLQTDDITFVVVEKYA